MALDAGGQLRLVVDNHVHARGGAARASSPGHRAQRDRDAVPNAPGALGAGAEADRRRRRERRIRVRRRLRRQLRPRRSCSASTTRSAPRRPRASDECASTSSRWTRSWSTWRPTAGCGSSTTKTGRPPTLQERRAIIHAARSRRLSRADRAARASSSSREVLRARRCVVFMALTAVMTYPQVLHMSDGVHDPGDPLMVTWVLAWVAHQLPNAPAQHLRRQHLLSRAQHAGLHRDAAPAGRGGGAAALARRRADAGLQPGVSVRLRAVGCRRRAARAPLTGNAGAAILAGIVFAFPPTASITRRTCSCSRRSSCRWRCGRSTGCSTAGGCGRRAARRLYARARCCRACTTASFLVPYWRSSAARC